MDLEARILGYGEELGMSLPGERRFKGDRFAAVAKVVRSVNHDTASFDGRNSSESLGDVVGVEKPFGGESFG
ncbi:MAG: hypothetical protein J5J06_06210 [Phycisphaerae bacterium]|nr:hypothetical protein [Phycisphaerae bacterium]